MKTKTKSKMKPKTKKILCVVLAFVLIISISLGIFLAPRFKKPDVDINPEKWNTNYTYVFVHGLSGWGSYDFQNKFMPYWGMMNGDLMKYLNSLGYDCVSASVAGQGSAWDRACELYAQLTGTVVDYGVAHSKEMGHDRFGTDYTGRALIDKFDSKHKINLLGHSFGGATIRMFLSLMTVGSQEEIDATPSGKISPFFTGGKRDWIYSLTCLAAPHNGTSAYHVPAEKKKESLSNKIMSMATSSKDDGRSKKDQASYDMNIDNAKVLNESLAFPENVYYFSIPCSASSKDKNGNYVLDKKITEGIYKDAGNAMGAFTGKTKGGFEIDASWKENDGLVNTISAKYPFCNPHTDFNKNDVNAGVWNVLPVYRGDHMSLQGGMTKRNDVRKLYAEHLDMINKIKK